MNALLLDSLDLLQEGDVVQRVGVLDVAAHEQVEVLRRHDHADVVEDACEVRERDAPVVLSHLRNVCLLMALGVKSASVENSMCYY